MTRSTNHPDADYLPSDMGPPPRLPTMAMWEKHTPEWEGMSQKRKKEWLEEHVGEDFSITYFNPHKDKYDDEETDRLIEL